MPQECGGRLGQSSLERLPDPDRSPHSLPIGSADGGLLKAPSPPTAGTPCGERSQAKTGEQDLHALLVRLELLVTAGGDTLPGEECDQTGGQRLGADAMPPSGWGGRALVLIRSTWEDSDSLRENG